MCRVIKKHPVLVSHTHHTHTMPRKCHPRVIYLCDCGLNSDDDDNGEEDHSIDTSSEAGVQRARQTVLAIVRALDDVSESDQEAIVNAIIDAATGDNGDGTSDDDAEIDLSTDEGLQAVTDAIDAMASSGKTPSAENIAKKIIQAVSYANNGMDLSTAEGVRRAQQEMLELATQPDPESQKRHENIALAIIRAASEAANAI